MEAVYNESFPDKRGGFRSYVDNRSTASTSSDASSLNARAAAGDLLEDEFEMLPGETLVFRAAGVSRYAPLSDHKTGVLGVLSVTNFRLSFPSAAACQEDAAGITNKLLKPNDVCLADIDDVVSVTEDGRRRRLSFPLPDHSKVDVLEVHCKDFRVEAFGFKFTSTEDARKLMNALLHHAFPLRIELLFAFECRLAPVADTLGTRMFRDAADWHYELDRSRCPGWRVSLVNENFQTCHSLPRHLVVPRKLLDREVNEAAPHYNKNRVPVWVWGTAEGAALVHSAKPAFDHSQHEAVVKEKIAEANPRGSMHIVDLDAFLPSTPEVQDAFVKWRAIHVPRSSYEFLDGDSRYLADVHASQWLHFVSKCLREASEIVVLLLEDDATVVLEESEGRDMAILVGSLIQVLADPYYRTQVGFQSLVQKEWVALGHPFCSRFARLQQPSSAAGAHQTATTPVESNSGAVASFAAASGITTLNANPVATVGKESQTLAAAAVPAVSSHVEYSRQSPVFLLFLDCVWQVLRQRPRDFEFTQTFLTAIWHSAHVSVFDTFLFDCVKDRENMIHADLDRLVSRSVWSWEYQYGERELEFFESPWTKLKREMSKRDKLGRGNVTPSPVTVNGLRDGDDVRMRSKKGPTERAERNVKSRSIPVGQITTLFSRVRRGDFSVTNNFNMDSINWEHGLSKLHEDCELRGGPNKRDLRWNAMSDYSRDAKDSEPVLRRRGYHQDRALNCTVHRKYLVPDSRLFRLDVWNQLYSRWLPATHVRFGGQDAFNMASEAALVKEIINLEQRLRLLSSIGDGRSVVPGNEECSSHLADCLRLDGLTSSFPFASEQASVDSTVLGLDLEKTFCFSRHYSDDDMLDSQSIIGS